MALPKSKFRELVFQILYSEDMGGEQSDSVLKLMMKELSVSKKNAREAWDRARMILDDKSRLDELISSSSKEYAFDRIPSVERNLLRLGVYELLFDEDIPPKVAITEALRLARKFSSKESGTFVNAVLDNIYQTKCQPET